MPTHEELLKNVGKEDKRLQAFDKRLVMSIPSKKVVETSAEKVAQAETCLQGQAPLIPTDGQNFDMPLLRVYFQLRVPPQFVPVP